MNSIGYLDNTTRVIEINSRSILGLESKVKPLEKDKLIKLLNYRYIRDYITFSKIYTLFKDKATLLDLLDNSYLE